MLGRDEDDPLLLQVKEAQPNVLEFSLSASAYGNAENAWSWGSG